MSYPDLNPARYPNETQAQYRMRRQAVVARMKQYSRGQYLHTSTEIVAAPVNVNMGRDVRDIKLITRKDGTVFQLGRTKGATYRRPEE
jgi:hypothetical protein